MDYLRKRPTARNPKTLARFRRESFWQITFPMIMLVLVLLGGIAGLFLWRGENGVAVVADYSMILMIVPMLLVGLIALAAIIGLIYLIVRAMELIPPYTYVAHKATFTVRDQVTGIANRITGFVIGIRSFLDGIVRYLKQRGLIPDMPDEAASPDAGRQS